MDDQLNQDLNEIADFIGARLETLMPALQSELQTTPAWPIIQIFGSYLHFRLEAQEILSDSPENYPEVHNHALGKTLALPLTQDFMQNMMTDMFNGMAGVGGARMGQPPSYDVSQFQEDYE